MSELVDAVLLVRHAEFRYFLRPSIRYIVYLRIFIIFFHLDAIMPAYHAGTECYLRPLAKYIVYWCYFLHFLSFGRRSEARAIRNQVLFASIGRIYCILIHLCHIHLMKTCQSKRRMSADCPRHAPVINLHISNCNSSIYISSFTLNAERQLLVIKQPDSRISHAYTASAPFPGQLRGLRSLLPLRCRL